jgi:hypothetical protein
MSANMHSVNGNGAAGRADSVTPFAFTAATDFKAVAVGAGANIEALTAYFTDPLLGTGNLPGLAISSFNNRALRQGTFVASSLCLWISGQIQAYVYDDGDQIKWQNEFQNALANFVSTLIPSNPDYTGVYLPILGGTMRGNINFQSGITTVLENNTFYQGKDTSGQSRGLIMKSNTNDVVINDGSSPRVTIAGAPVANNNFSWSGRDTSANVRPLIGLLSDNAIHIGSSTTSDIYFDITGAVHLAGNVILNNNHYLYGNDTGATPRALLGLANDNGVYIASGAQSTTHIYSGGGQSIQLHTNVLALAQLQVNGTSYLQAFTRCYIPGGNDPLQILADNGFYSRIHYITSGVREWSAGCLNNGNYAIADESAHAFRWQIDTAGNITVYNSQTVNGSMAVSGGLTVYNGLNVASGGFNCGNAGMQAVTINNGLNVYNGLSVNSGNIGCNGTISTPGTVSGGYVYSGGQVYGASSVVTPGTVQGGYIYSTGNLDIAGSMGVAGNFNCSNQVSSNTVYGNFVHSNGDMTCQGNFYATGTLATPNHLSAGYGFCLGGAGFNFDYTFAAPYGAHFQMVGGLGMYAQFFSSYSDERLKKNIDSVERDAVTAIKALQFYSYDSPHTSPKGEEIIDKRSHVALGFLAQQVQETLADAVIETDQPTIFHMDHPETGTIGCDYETQPVLAIDVMTMLAYSLRAIQQLTDRLEQLEGRRA